MLEPPSRELVRQLTELQLCQPGDLRRARGRVRRLAFDIPAFDSVWIDSLVQLRLLTPYQAKQLELGQADQLRIGSFVVIDELGRSDRGTTLLVRRLHRRDRCVVKRQKVASDRIADVSRQMQLVVEQANGFAHPQLVLPNEIIPSTENELVTVSRLVPGLPLNELLVRRGRFPAPIVFEIGRQLLEGLAALHVKSLLHGDIRMSNVRLTDNGLAVLVEGGMRQIIHSEITIHDRMALEAYDGLAPELIGTGSSVSASSDLYSVGCLLWQLLAGRPPYTTADPLAKIAAHQTRTICDVRLLAPDTPALLADMICQMTSPVVQERPRSFDEVLRRWGRPGSFSRSRLRQFRRLFDGAVPHFAGPTTSDGLSHWIWLAAALCTIGGGIAVISENGLKNELLDITRHVGSSIRKLRDAEPGTSSVAPIDPNNAALPRVERVKGLLSLPKPSAEGVILLEVHGPYKAGNVAFAGNLTIRGATGIKPEIHVENDPLTLTAQAVTFDQVRVRSVANTPPDFLVKISSRQLDVSNSEFLTNLDDADGTQEIVALAWKPFEPKSGLIIVKNSVFHGTGAAMLVAQPPRQMKISNTLKTGRGAFVSFGSKCVAVDTKLELDHVTLRETGPLLRLAGEFASKTGITPIQIEARGCAFSLADPKSGFITIDSDRPRTDARKSVEMTATKSVVVPGTVMLTKFDSERNRFHDEDADDQFQGLDANEIKFAGDKPFRTLDARTVGLKGPRNSADVELPGIDLSHLGPSSQVLDKR